MNCQSAVITRLPHGQCRNTNRPQTHEGDGISTYAALVTSRPVHAGTLLTYADRDQRIGGPPVFELNASTLDAYN